METTLGNKTVYGFGVGDFTFNLLMSMAVNYYLVFLTEVVGISAAASGSMLLIARICDAISVIVTGLIIQRMSFSKFGKFRTWIICIPPVTALFFILMFSNFNMGLGAKTALLGICYVCAHCCVNFVYNAHMALVPVMSKTPGDGISLSAKKMQFTTASQVVFGLASMAIVLLFAGKSVNMARGYQMTVVVFAILHVLGYWCVAAVSKPYDIYTKAEKGAGAAEASIGANLKSVVSNKPLLLIMCADTFKWMAAISVLTLGAYYFIYIVNDISRISILLTVVGIAGFLGSLLGQVIAKALDKKLQYLIGSIISVACYLIARVFALQLVPFVLFVGLATFAAGVSNTVNIAMYADCGEYWIVKTGKNVIAFIMSMYAMPIKIGVALAGAVCAFGLDLVHYVPNMAPTPELAGGIANIITFLPAAGCALMTIFAFLYPLTGSKMNELRGAGK